MESVRELHKLAMQLAEQAALARLRGDLRAFDQLISEALDKERQAAEILTARMDAEPTRSVLFRSAASLALECNQVREAERLASSGLAGNPPEEIAEELRDLMQQAQFARHLKLRGIQLGPNEVQISMSGPGIGEGVAELDEFLTRVGTFESLIYRTSERKQQIPYRRGGSPAKLVQAKVMPFVSMPRAGSFVVTLRLGSHFQQELFEKPHTEVVIDEILDCVDLFNKSKEDVLEERINEPEYFSNFVGLAKRLSPDGAQVRQIGLTAFRYGEARSVNLTRTRTKLTPSVETLTSDQSEGGRGDGTVRVVGRLGYADTITKSSDRIILEDDSGQQHKVIVPPGMMSDIVKPLWDEVVVISGTKKGTSIILEDIDRCRD